MSDEPGQKVCADCYYDLTKNEPPEEKIPTLCLLYIEDSRLYADEVNNRRAWAEKRLREYPHQVATLKAELIKAMGEAEQIINKADQVITDPDQVHTIMLEVNRLREKLYAWEAMEREINLMNKQPTSDPSVIAMGEDGPLMATP